MDDLFGDEEDDEEDEDGDSDNRFYDGGMFVVFQNGNRT